MRTFTDLNERDVLALAISLEEEDSRIYADFADGLREDFPASAAMFSEMADEESGHRHRLISLYQAKFGPHIPLIRRQDVRGFQSRKPIWQVRPLGIETARQYAREMEQVSRRFYQQAASRCEDASIRKLLGDLAQEEVRHEHTAEDLERAHLTPAIRATEHESEKRRFILRIVQPGLVGLMDGSVSTLAPVFAAAFSTHRPFDAFLVGLAAAVGAGISMGLAEGLADDGKLSGRGSPMLRGLVCGLMTMLGGFGHTLPFLIPHFWTATLVACGVVAVELAAISFIRWRYMDSPVVTATLQVAFGGALVFATGVVIGST